MQGKRFFWLGCALLTTLALTGHHPVTADKSSPAPVQRVSADCGCNATAVAPARTTISAAERAHTLRQVRASLGTLPLQFEPNVGQAPGPVKYLARGSGYHLFLTGRQAVLTLRHKSAHGVKTAPVTLRMALAGKINTASFASGQNRMRGKVNYFLGNDPKRWHTNIPTYRMVRYNSVYRGVDLLYYGNRGRLEYDFVVAPHADPHTIAVQFSGAGKPRLAANGDLRMPVAGGNIGWHRPIAYQTVNGKRHNVEARFALRSDHSVGFTLGRYNTHQALVIDPTLLYSTYLGGTGDEFAYGVAVDTSGMVYMTGNVTDITNPVTPPIFPAVAGAYQTTNNGNADAFLAKLDPSMPNSAGLIYATYLGGADDDGGLSVAVDGQNEAYISGFTSSADFPTKTGGLDTTFGGADNTTSDAFVTKFSADGAMLGYSTYLGGDGDDAAYGIAVDTNGAAYVVGTTNSTGTSFKPAPPNSAYQAMQQGGAEGFFVEINKDGNNASYSTYIGGGGEDIAFGVAIDPTVATNSTAYITGRTTSTDLKTTPNAFQKNVKGTQEQAFVIAINPAAQGAGTVPFLSYLGGSAYNSGNAIAYGSDKHIYITGATSSSDLPTTSTAEQSAAGTGSDAFLSVIDPAAAAATGSLIYSTYLGGFGDDYGTGIALLASPTSTDPNHVVATVTGYSSSINEADVTGGTNNAFAPTGDALQQDNGSQGNGQGQTTFDAFMAQVDASLSGATSLVYLSYLGGSDDELDQDAVAIGGPGCSVAIDNSGSVYVVGSTFSQDFATTTVTDGTEAYQLNNQGGVDAFLVKLTFGVTLSSVTLPAQSCGGSTASGTVDLTGVAPTNGAQIALSSDNPNLLKFVDGTGQPLTSVTINPGEVSAQFQVVLSTVTVDTPVTVTASYTANGISLGSVSTVIIIKAPTLKTFTLNGGPTTADPTTPSVGTGGTVTGSVVISCPSSVGGKIIYLKSDNPAVAPVPNNVTVLAGTNQLNFTFTAGPVTTSTTVHVTASETANGTGITIPLTVRPSVLVSITVAPNPVAGGVTVTGTATLDGNAPPAGVKVALRSDNAVAVVPASVTIPSGSASATFSITTKAVTADVTANITGTLNGITKSYALIVQPVGVTSVVFDPTTILAGSTSTGTVTVNSPAPAAGFTVTLSSSSAAVTVPASVTVLAGKTTATFTATGQPVAQSTTATVTASLNSRSQSAKLIVTPVLVSSISVDPSTIAGGGIVNATVTIDTPAPENGVTISLTSSAPNAAPVVQTVQIDKDSQSTNFVIATKGTVNTVVATLTARYGSTPAKTTTLTVVGAALESLTLAPPSIVGGGISIATLTLSSAAPDAGITANISSSNPAVAALPTAGNIKVPSGATQITFPVQTHAVTSTQSPVITATYNGKTVSGTLTVTQPVGGTFSSGLQLFSVPYDYPTTPLDSIFGYANVSLAVYAPTVIKDAPYYALTPTAPADHIRLGRGYWARFPNSIVIQQVGTPADPTKDFSLDLEAGWSMIGDPFLASVALDDLKVQSGDDTLTYLAATAPTAPAQPIISGTLYYYPGGTGAAYSAISSGGSMTPGRGYWIYAFERTTLIFPHP